MSIKLGDPRMRTCDLTKALGSIFMNESTDISLCTKELSTGAVGVKSKNKIGTWIVGHLIGSP